MKTAKINKASLVREAKDFLEGGLSQAVLISVNSRNRFFYNSKSTKYTALYL